MEEISQVSINQVPPNMSQAPVVEPVKKNFLPLVLTSVPLLLLCIFLGYQNYQLRQTISLQSTSPSPVPIPSPSVTTNYQDVVSGWKRYVHPSNGFTFQYPDNVIEVKKYESEDTGTMLTLITSTHYDEQIKEQVESIPLTIYIGNKDSLRKDHYFGGYLMVKDRVDALSKLENSKTMKGTKEDFAKLDELNVGDVMGYRYASTPNIEGGNHTGLAVIRGNDSYLFVYDHDLGDISISDFEKIVSSVAFGR